MLVIDCEWPICSDGIHMVGSYNTESQEYMEFQRAEELRTYLIRHKDASICGHAFIYADLPRLRDHWDIDLSDRTIIDTWTMSCFYQPSIQGGHSLGEWGKRLGDHKGDFTDFDEPAEGETRAAWMERMGLYMKQDVLLTHKLECYLVDKLNDNNFAPTALVTELQVAKIVQKQIETGFYFDVDKATKLYTTLTAKLNGLKEVLETEFPPIVTQRISEKTGKRLKDKVEPFNPGSRLQIANRLLARGVKLKEKTPKGAWKIDDEILEEIKHPAAKSIHEYMTLQKRISQMDQWFLYYNQETHRLHGRVNPLGTNTHRQSQSKPNLAQIPSVRKIYGKECRELFTVPDGKKLVGADASSLELRLLANRLKDPDFKEQVETGDVHTYNMEMAGLKDRDQAKTFIYALIYGARDGKLAHILDVSMNRAGVIRNRFYKNIPAFEEFREKVESEAQRTGTITLLDGSKVWMKSIHSCLNFQLQGDGAVVMKKALVLAQPSLSRTTAKLVVQAHDEWQFETEYWDCDLVGKIAVKAIEDTTDAFDMYVKLTGEYKVGTSWASTH